MAALIGRGLGSSVARSDARDAKSSGEGSGAWPGLPDHERFTLVFDGSLRAHSANPFLTDTPFGRPVAVAVGDAVSYWDAQGDGMEWFWKIVDAEGLADLPSDERAALSTLCRLASDASRLQLARFRLALERIAEGVVPPDQAGHYLAHRECVRLARAALSPPSAELGTAGHDRTRDEPKSEPDQ